MDTFRIPNPPWRFDDEVEPITGVPKFRGEDNRAVLRELLGYDDPTITHSKRRRAEQPTAALTAQQERWTR